MAHLLALKFCEDEDYRTNKHQFSHYAYILSTTQKDINSDEAHFFTTILENMYDLRNKDKYDEYLNLFKSHVPNFTRYFQVLNLLQTVALHADEYSLAILTDDKTNKPQNLIGFDNHTENSAITIAPKQQLNLTLLANKLVIVSQNRACYLMRSDKIPRHCRLYPLNLAAKRIKLDMLNLGLNLQQLLCEHELLEQLDEKWFSFDHLVTLALAYTNQTNTELLALDPEQTCKETLFTENHLELLNELKSINHRVIESTSLSTKPTSIETITETEKPLLSSNKTALFQCHQELKPEPQPDTLSELMHQASIKVMA